MCHIQMHYFTTIKHVYSTDCGIHHMLETKKKWCAMFHASANLFLSIPFLVPII